MTLSYRATAGYPLPDAGTLAVAEFDTLEEFTAASEARGWVDGTIVKAAGLLYVRKAGEDSIDDLPGWLLTIDQNASDYARAAQGDTVALVESTAAGVLAVSDGETFAVAADGGLSLYRRNGSTATLLIEEYRPNAPLVPHVAPASPAIITAMEALKSEGVPLKMVLGRSYSSGNDGAGTLNSVLPDIAGEGLTIRDPDGTVMRCTQPIRPPTSGLTLEFGPKTLITKDFASSGLANALFCQSSFATNTDSLRITGGVWQALDDGIMFAVWGDDMHLTDMVIRDFSDGQGLMFGGNRVRLSNLRVFTDDPATGTGAIRYHGGEDMRAIGCYAKCGDDALQLAPVGTDTAARFGVGIDNAWYIGCTGISARARVAVIQLPIQVNPSNTAYAGIRNGGFLGCSGVSPATPVQIVHEKPVGSTIVGAESNMIDDIVVSGFRGTGARPGTLTEFAQSILINDEIGNGIGRLTFRDFVLADNNLALGVKADLSATAEVLFDNCEITGEEAAIQIRTGGRFTFRGGRYAIKDNGGLITYPAGSRTPVSVIQTLSGGSSVTVLDDVVLEGIPSSGDGFRANSGHTLRSGCVTANEAAGATSTRALNIVSGGTGSIGAPPTGTVDSPTNYGVGTVSVLYPGTTGITGTLILTVSTNGTYTPAQLANVVYIDGALTRTPTWTISNSGAPAGMRVRFVMRDTTIYSAILQRTGAVVLATLTAPGDWADLIYDGSEWQLEARSATGGGTGVAVASLPAANTVGSGARAFVTDANATTFQSVVAGGGANAVPVYSDGANWRIG